MEVADFGAGSGAHALAVAKALMSTGRVYAIDIQQDLLSKLKNIHDNSGVALVLTIIILANLLMITLIVTDVILRIGKSSQQIGESEIAYFAAESAMEQAIYKIEKEKSVIDLGEPGTPTSAAMSESSGWWERQIEGIYETPTICVDDQQKLSYRQTDDLTPAQILALVTGEILTGKSCIYSPSSGFINHQNVLIAILKPDKSFEFNLDITAEEDSFDYYYPDYIDITWREFYPPRRNDPDGKIIVLTPSGQLPTYDTSVVNTVKVPVSGNLGNDPQTVIRIINENGSCHINPSQCYVIYEFKPGGATDNLPVGITITTTGYYGNYSQSEKKKERIIETERRNWQIY